MGRPGPHRHPGLWHDHCGFRYNDWVYDRWDRWEDYWDWRAVSGAIRLGAYYLTQPWYYTVTYYEGVYYYYSDGVWYVRDGALYRVVPAPYGAVVAAAPVTYDVVSVQDTTTDGGTGAANNYLYANGVYYVETEDDPSVPDAQLAAAENARAEAGKNDVSDKQRQEASKDPTAKDEGQPQEIMADPDPGTNYQVVAPPKGATVTHLPDDAIEKTIGETKYAVYSGTWYQAFYSGSSVVYRVVDKPSGAA